MDRFDEGNKLKTAHHVALYASSGEKKTVSKSTVVFMTKTILQTVLHICYTVPPDKVEGWSQSGLWCFLRTRALISRRTYTEQIMYDLMML